MIDQLLIMILFFTAVSVIIITGVGLMYYRLLQKLKLINRLMIEFRKLVNQAKEFEFLKEVME